MILVLKFLKCDRGTTALEYALIGTAVSIVIIGGARAIGTSLSNKWLGPLAAGLN